MPDLKTRFRGAARITAPDLWPDITSREPRRPGPEPSFARRVFVATLALALAVGGVALVIRAFEGPRDRPQPITPAPGSMNGVISYASIGEQQVFWTVRPDGTDRTRVHIDVPGFVGLPSWSPDGTRIAFDVNSYEDPHPEGGNSDIYTANADGTDPTRLTFEQVDHSPVWSPDGSRIAYVHGDSDDQQIWVMNADGSDPDQVTDGKGPNTFPSWSPDGSNITFVSFDGSNADVYVVNADGSDVRRLTDDPSHEDRPAWSPDGRQIAFTSEGAGNPGIYVMSPDGTGVTQLLRDPDPANLGFAWSPDGTMMAVVSIRGPGNDRTMYVLDVATGELTAIGEQGAFYGLSWQPLLATPSPTRSASAPAAPGTCDYGPWMEECPEADWARLTLEAAGPTVFEETPAAFVVQHRDGEFNFWAMDPANHQGVEPLDKELKTGDPFQVVQRVDGVSLYHLRTRWVWTVHGLNVWVSVASGSEPAPDILESLVRASIMVPY